VVWLLWCGFVFLLFWFFGGVCFGLCGFCVLFGGFVLFLWFFFFFLSFSSFVNWSTAPSTQELSHPEDDTRHAPAVLFWSSTPLVFFFLS